MEALKTEFRVEVVKLGKIEKHPNADSLSITHLDGYPVVLKTGTFNEGDLAVYCSVDSIVPTDRPEFAFLKKGDRATHRIKAMRLRGVFSMGLLIQFNDSSGLGPLNSVPESHIGRDMAQILGVTKYIPKEELDQEAHENRIAKARMGKKAGWIKLDVYGLDSARKYIDIFEDGQEVVITEKIHGSNFRACFSKGRLWVGSHKTMRGATEHWLWLKIKKLLGFKPKDGKSDIWWEMAEKYQLAERLAKFPDYVLYGEVYGEKVQDLTYDSPKGRKLRFFDIYDRKGKRFLDYWHQQELLEDMGFNIDAVSVPDLYVGPWSQEVWQKYKALADTGMTTLLVDGKSPHLIEGIVIKPEVEQYNPRVGRVALKYVGENYLTRKGD